MKTLTNSIRENDQIKEGEERVWETQRHGGIRVGSGVERSAKRKHFGCDSYASPKTEREETGNYYFRAIFFNFLYVFKIFSKIEGNKEKGDIFYSFLKKEEKKEGNVFFFIFVSLQIVI